MIKRGSYSMQEDLFNRVAEKAQGLSISVSAYISIACAEKIKNDEALASFPDAVRLMKLMQNEKDKQG